MSTVRSAVRRDARRAARRLHTATKAAMIGALLVGIVLGAALVLLVSVNDRFVLKGEKSYSVDLGEPYYYEEEGVEAVCFGLDVADKLTVETSLEKDSEGRYIIPTDKEGVYTITYTVDCFKFGEHAPNGEIKCIRTFTVSAAEEEDRNVEE